MGDATEKVGTHLRRVGNTRWAVKGYARRQRSTADVLEADQPTLVKPVASKPESEIARLIRKAQGGK